MGLFNNKPKKLKPKKITLAQAIEYAKNPEYNMLYEFIPVDLENLQAGYIPKLKEEVLQTSHETKSTYMPDLEEKQQPKIKKNSSFINRIKVDDTYKGINQGMSKKLEKEAPKYGDYKSSKRYKGDIR